MKKVIFILLGVAISFSSVAQSESQKLLAEWRTDANTIREKILKEVSSDASSPFTKEIKTDNDIAMAITSTNSLAEELLKKEEALFNYTTKCLGKCSKKSKNKDKVCKILLCKFKPSPIIRQIQLEAEATLLFKAINELEKINAPKELLANAKKNYKSFQIINKVILEANERMYDLALN